MSQTFATGTDFSGYGFDCGSQNLRAGQVARAGQVSRVGRVARVGQGNAASAAQQQTAIVPPAGKLRLTRRGRVVFGVLGALLVAAMLALTAFFMAPGASATNQASGANFPHLVAQSGDTLWQIALELDPQSDPRDLIYELVRLNQLPNSSVQAGAHLAVPQRFADNPRVFIEDQA